MRRVVIASSSSVYGDNPALPKQEDMCPRPLSPYAVSKLSGEQYCQTFWRVYGLETVALRYFNVFGPRQNPDSQYAAVIPKFITAILAGDVLTVHGDGTQSRDFTYVDNVVQRQSARVYGTGCARRRLQRGLRRPPFAPGPDRLALPTLRQRRRLRAHAVPRGRRSPLPG